MSELPPRSFRQKLAKFAAARLDREGYLGLHLTVGLVLTAGALWLFYGLTGDVVRAEAITRLDADVNTWVRTHATITGYGVFGALTQLGAPVSLAVIALAGAIVFAAKRRTVMLIGWAGAFAGGALLDAALKLLVHRPRPPYAMDYLVRESWSYPSGHSLMSLVCFGMLAYVLCTRRVRGPVMRVVVVIAAAAMTLVVGTSRVYLGVHYISDVIAGFVAGTVWLTVCISSLEITRRKVPTPPPPSAGTAPTR